MEPKNIRNQISKHKDEIYNIKKQIEELQSNCDHDETEVKNISEGVSQLRLVCKTCQKVIGYPSKDDLTNAGY